MSYQTLTHERFADIEILRYQVKDFNTLTLKQKTYLYHLCEAALCGRDILYDQNGIYNLRIRRLLEAIYTNPKLDHQTNQFKALSEYLKRVWFSSGIHHHYSGDKFLPNFSETYLKDCISILDHEDIPLTENESIEHFCNEIFPIIFDAQIMPKRINLNTADDVIVSSANNYYGKDITQKEVEEFYNQKKDINDPQPPMWGLNSRLVKENEILKEVVWKADGLYGKAISQIIKHLSAAKEFVESEIQSQIINLLIEFYKTGDLRIYDAYFIQWLQDTHNKIDFCNNFIETYGDSLGIKASWEALVNIKDSIATKRTEILSRNAEWFEHNSPADPAFKKKHVKGISAKVISAAILAGDLYPSSAIGINLPNSDWMRKDYGSKSVTIGNLTASYAEAAQSSGMAEEFILDKNTINLIKKYGHLTDDLHTDLHECLGHGSGKLLKETDPDALRSYGATIEEARADIFGLYFIADTKMVDLGLLPDMEAYKAQYYSYILNGLLTQLVRIEVGKDLEESHMRNRALISNWAYILGKTENIIEIIQNNNKTYLRINNYEKLREIFAYQLAEIQRVKSEGDYNTAKTLVETYGVKIDPKLHQEILSRYSNLKLAPYKGFINPKYTAIKDSNNQIIDVQISYDETYSEQMLRYSKDYSFLPHVN